MQIRDRFQQTADIEGKLVRMADLSLWGEAAARAMGYDPMEFKAYGENLKNQNKDAVNFNALAQIMCNICQNELVTKHTQSNILFQIF
ncbi:MAG TPA: hypothetical protein VFJ51_10305 [Nitrososphaeraceae archaeon]|nr:hypothetical protein [Nitrososphaeraceae archaeon]